MIKCKYFEPYMEDLRYDCERLYEMDGCRAGGPLHILLDDDNYDTDSILFCKKMCEDYSEEIKYLGRHICDVYLSMSLEERAIFDWYWCGSDLECDTERCCKDCEYLGELYEYMLEVEQEYEQKKQQYFI